MDVTRFSDIGEELVENILMRLPIKSLKQLSCVNKGWYSLIKSSYFISRHYSHHSSSNVKILVKHSTVDCYTPGNDVISLLSETDGDFSHQSIPFLNKNNTVKIICPCINGIICLKIFTVHEPFEDIALWNVATGEYNILSKLQFSTPPKAYLEPRIGGLGFGWVPETNEYKVVMAIDFWQKSCNNHDCIPYYRPSEFFLYTLSTNSWKQLNLEIPFCTSYIGSFSPSQSQIYVDGVCYWVNRTLGRIYKIFSFHVRDEVFGSLDQLPDIEIPNHGYLNLSLHMIDGCIALINDQSDKLRFLADIWVMEKTWVKKFKIGPLINIQAKLGLVKDELFLEDESGQLLSINVNSHQVKNLGIRGKHTFRVLEYVESLVPIKRWL